MDNKTIKEAAGKENISVSDNTTENGTEKEETAMEKMRKNIDTLAFPTLINKPNLNDVIAFKVDKKLTFFCSQMFYSKFFLCKRH